MSLLRVRFGDFRNLGRADVELSPRFTVFHGQNGAGKTNVLEGIYLVSTLRSFRTAELRPLVRRGQTSARVEATVHEPATGLDSSLAVALQVHERSTRRSALVDHKAVRAAADFYGRLRAVLFTPEDLAVLRGPPSGRRQVLDRVLFARDRAHLLEVSRYEKLLRSRNAVLRAEGARSVSERDALLDAYDAGLAPLGARIWDRRRRAVALLSEPFAAAYREIQGEGGRPGLAYESRLGEPDPAAEVDALGHALADSLAHARRDDLRRRTTSVGPHRDDLAVTLDGVPAAAFASQGQTRTLMLAFKIAELRTAPRDGVGPLLLLDDVSSELDPARNARLFAVLEEGVGQCILTTTAPHFVPLPHGPGRRDVLVADGCLT